MKLPYFNNITHVVQLWQTRAWWLLPTVVLAGTGELIGWTGRTWSHYDPLEYNAYLIQTVTLIIAPTPLIGALFITFGRLSARLGQEYSRLSPRLYSRIFFTCDFVALLVQAGGGGIAASTSNIKTSEMGSNIMLGGIIFQLISLSVFCVLVAEYLVRRFKDRPLGKATMNDSTLTLTDTLRGPVEKPMRLLALGLCMEALFLYIRGIYRTVELADGWNGKVIQTQSLFIVFDGVMVFLTMFTLNVFHPGRLLKNAGSGGGAGMSEKNVAV
ncbi:RTA1 like protein [Trametes versicolor FP-101664 SS1]|uniref:RTA1 like protein n=1 Tax=Trametes versicolor (strain FP-101664) TaxID=717944 RepID=UPI0004622BC9|nr:RTA1 like protein [Trametes versicolor FP-101664 SS1]EIW64627.1 RTA1 like protein [Trametes versicolor FP-101664 SS1]